MMTKRFAKVVFAASLSAGSMMLFTPAAKASTVCPPDDCSGMAPLTTCPQGVIVTQTKDEKLSTICRDCSSDNLCNPTIYESRKTSYSYTSGGQPKTCAYTYYSNTGISCTRI